MKITRIFAAGALLGSLALLAGCCHSTHCAPTTRSAHADEQTLDAERAQLAKFVGAWEYEGWSIPEGESRRAAKGIASGVIEHAHFVLFDTLGEVMQGDDGRAIKGSILFSVEPGVGLMLTSWSDDSTAVHRFDGDIENYGLRFVFTSYQPLWGPGSRVKMVIEFSTRDQWTATFHREGAVVAEYTFNRV
jgi:hypothetical protein